MNEDVVIPMPKIPDFAHFLELLNLEMAGKAYRYALQEIGRLQGFPMQDTEFNKEFSYASKIAGAENIDVENGEIEISDDELTMRATLFIDSWEKPIRVFVKKSKPFPSTCGKAASSSQATCTRATATVT